MRPEPEKARILRALIHTAETDPDFLEKGMEHLGLAPKLGKDLILFWQAAWGSLADGVVNDKEALIWTRPDRGPAVADHGTYAVETKIMRFALMAKLIEALQEAHHLTFVATGVPDNWRRCRVFFNDELLTGVIWADVITGMCSVHNKDKKAGEPGAVPSTVRSGSVAIVLGDKDLGFF